MPALEAVTIGVAGVSTAISGIVTTTLALPTTGKCFQMESGEGKKGTRRCADFLFGPAVSEPLFRCIGPENISLRKRQKYTRYIAADREPMVIRPSRINSSISRVSSRICPRSSTPRCSTGGSCSSRGSNPTNSSGRRSGAHVPQEALGDSTARNWRRMKRECPWAKGMNSAGISKKDLVEAYALVSEREKHRIAKEGTDFLKREVKRHIFPQETSFFHSLCVCRCSS